MSGHVRYLVAFDYGQGGIWGYVIASSKEKIISRFPEVEVVDETPSWMTDDLRKRLEELTEELDRPEKGVLGTVLAHRHRSASQ